MCKVEIAGYQHFLLVTLQRLVNKFVELGILLYNSRFFFLFLYSINLCQLNDNSRPVNTYIIFIRPLKTGRSMGSPVAGGWAASPILCPEYISKTILAMVMKLHGWIELKKAECSAQES